MAIKYFSYFIIGILIGIGCDQFLGIKFYAIAQYASIKGFSRNQTLTLNDQSNLIINSSLEKLLNDIINSKRASVAIIHGSNLAFNPSLIPLFKYDITNSRSVEGYFKSILRSDLPLNQWSEYIPSLLSNKCQDVEVESATNFSIDRQIGNTSYVVCPIMNQKKELIGGLFLYFDSPKLDNQDFDVLSKKMKEASMDIAQALIIRLDKEYRF